MVHVRKARIAIGGDITMDTLRELAELAYLDTARWSPGENNMTPAEVVDNFLAKRPGQLVFFKEGTHYCVFLHLEQFCTKNNIQFIRRTDSIISYENVMVWNVLGTSEVWSTPVNDSGTPLVTLDKICNVLLLAKPEAISKAMIKLADDSCPPSIPVLMIVNK